MSIPGRRKHMHCRVTPIPTESTRNLSESVAIFRVLLQNQTLSASLDRYILTTMLSSPSASFDSDEETLRRNRILKSKLYFDVPLSKVKTLYIHVFKIPMCVCFIGLRLFDQSGSCDLLGVVWYSISRHGKAVRTEKLFGFLIFLRFFCLVFDICWSSVFFILNFIFLW